jgi:hypothetical protein
MRLLVSAIFLSLFTSKIFAYQLRNEIRGNVYSNIVTTHVRSMGIDITIRYPRSVYAGERYIIYASMRNRIDYARMGGLTLSFPQYNSIDANIISKRFDKLNGYLPPSKLYSRIYGRNIPIDYYVIEGWENKWDYDTSRYMKIELQAPYSISRIDINVRGVLVFGQGRNKEEVAVPRSSYIQDQQGYNVKRISIRVR